MTDADAQSFATLVIVATVVGGVGGVLLYVWYAAALSRVFTKLGAESWRGWVPVVNEMEIFVRGGLPGWSVVYSFIPVVQLYGVYLRATAVHRINLLLGRGAAATVLGVLLPPVWASLLAWGSTATVPGVDGKRAEGMRPAFGGAASAPSGPLAPPPPAPPLAPVTVSDASGYALPVQPAAPMPAAPLEAAPAAAVPEAAASSASPAPGMIQNPWAQAEAAPAAPVLPAAPVVPPAAAFVSTPPPGTVAPAPPAAPRPPAPPVVDSTDEADRTVVVERRPVVPWRLTTDEGFVVQLSASKVVLGRNPSSSELDVQAIAVPDSTKTLSKTHARLDLVDGAWTVTDLHSTNGVTVYAADGEEIAVAVAEPTPFGTRLRLGRIGMSLSSEPGSLS